MISCPCSCGDLNPIMYEGVEVDVCPKCHGVWLDYGELGHIVRTRERAWTSVTITKVLKDLGGFNAPPLGENRKLLCPICESVLDEVNYQGTSNIIVNPCEHMHGVWLDCGEIAKIQIYMEYWANYAKEHEAEISSDLDEISKEYDAGKDRMIENGPSSLNAMNVFIYEALEVLEKWNA